MCWGGKSVRDQRVEFVIRASRGEALSSLCREYGISRPTGYLWLKRFREQGIAGIEERSRRPLTSPLRTSPALEERIAGVRRERPDWGARKLAVLLEREGTPVPVITVHRVLSRLDLVSHPEARRQATRRFEREAPNQLWQMDFKGQKGTTASTGPLSVMDDHSRYVVALEQTRQRPGGENWLQQPWLDAFRHEYNHTRPHEALNMHTPASCWRPSQRAYDPAPPAWDYGPGAMVRRVDAVGHISWKDHLFHVSRALAGQQVALEEAEQRLMVFFCNCLVSEINLQSHRTARAVRWLPNYPQNCKGSPDNAL